jgi:DNA-binding transcriptional regulator YdaS (Cro superfamily)
MHVNPKELAEAAGFKTVTDLAAALGIKPPSINQWRRVPAERAVQIEKVSGGKLPRHKMRPDLFPAPAKRGRA